MEHPYDAILFMSFGGPEGPDDVMPFLENVTRGKNVPQERLAEVAHHYQLFGGKSPINEQNRRLIAGLQKELTGSGLQFPVYWGNRNWHPLLEDTLLQMARDGVKRALAFVTSAYSSYSSCRQYLNDIKQAQQKVGNKAPLVDKIRAFFNHPKFIEANADNLKMALNKLPCEKQAVIIFTAHSIPLNMASGSLYETQLQEACRLVMERTGHNKWYLAYQSRSGPASQPWLEPDIGDCLKELHGSGVKDVVIQPIGFVSDHMEVIYDIDVVAKRICDELKLNMVRAATAGTHPLFIKMIEELILERFSGNSFRASLGAMGSASDVCQPGCCLY